MNENKALLVSVLETFLTNNNLIDNTDLFELSSVYEYIDNIDIVKYNKEKNYMFFTLRNTINDDYIFITIEYKNNIPYSILINDKIYTINSMLEKNIKNIYNKRLNENLSFYQLKSEVVPQSKANQNLNYFYKQRNKLNGQGNRNIKFVTSQFDPTDGSMLFMYRTDATYNNEYKKELSNNNPNDGELIKNISDEYDIQLKVCDFWKILENLIVPNDNDFTKEDMKAVLELSEEVRINCSCPSQYWMGSDFYLTQIDAQLKDCTIVPKWWNRPDLRPNILVCKHLLSLLQHISFFLPQMAMSCKKELKDYGLI